jgi:8-amino-7-oxononanoate synthase
MITLAVLSDVLIMQIEKSDHGRTSGLQFRRQFRTMEHLTSTTARLDGNDITLFCTNDYLGLSKDPRVIDASVRATRTHGAGSGASRLVSGTLPIHTLLEERIAEFKKTEAAVLFGSGYLANIAVIPTLVSSDDLLLCDRLNHASLWDGCRLSRAPFRVYKHKNTPQLVRYLDQRERSARPVIVTDGIFSMDGDLAPLPDLFKIIERRGGLLIVDDAHATGVIGPEGKGTFDHYGRLHGDAIEIGTLGKALGSYGAYAAGPAHVIRELIQSSRSLIYSTAPAPGSIAAAIESLDIISKEPDRRERLQLSRDRILAGMAQLGIRYEAHVSPIFPVIIGSEKDTVFFSEALLAQGIYIPSIRPPTVPDGTSRLRLTISSEHTLEQIDRLIDSFSVVLRSNPKLTVSAPKHAH